MVENALSLAILLLAVALAIHGLRRLRGFGLLAAALLFCVASAAVWSGWQYARAHHQPFVIAEFFLFMAAVGAFQVGVGAQGIADGYIRGAADADGVAPTSLYLLLLAPDGDPIYYRDRPARFATEVVGRVVMGLVLAFFLPLLMLAWSLGRAG